MNFQELQMLAAQAEQERLKLTNHQTEQLKDFNEEIFEEELEEEEQEEMELETVNEELAKKENKKEAAAKKEEDKDWVKEVMGTKQDEEKDERSDKKRSSSITQRLLNPFQIELVRE